MCIMFLPFISSFSFYSWGFLQRQNALVVNILVLILTVMKTSIASSIVSCCSNKTQLKDFQYILILTALIEFHSFRAESYCKVLLYFLFKFSFESRYFQVYLKKCLKKEWVFLQSIQFNIIYVLLFHQQHGIRQKLGAIYKTIQFLFAGQTLQTSAFISKLLTWVILNYGSCKSNFYCCFSLPAFRAQQGDVIRMACRLDPHTGFQMAGEWLKYQLSLPLDTGTANCKFL